MTARRDLAGTKALVTGGNQGFGFALAGALARAGAEVVICGRRQDAVEGACARLPGVHGVCADVTHSAERSRLLATAAEQMGGLTLLVNNAAIQNPMRFTAASAPQLAGVAERELAADLLAPIALTTEALPYLAGEPDAAVAFLTSTLGFMPKQSAPVYCAAKAGVQAFAESLRHQWRNGQGPRSITILLPLVDTKMTQGRGRAKVSPQRAADAAVRALLRGRDDIVVPPAGVVRRLHGWAPQLVGRVTRDS
ncbi:MAG: oxidoreductase [Actinobacteria bacterium HGW-Actinobacteria-2]|nr:MAG: oxidoreductase [Actinobacteria bacterium HGW-Actinobacteria-2]